MKKPITFVLLSLTILSIFITVPKAAEAQEVKDSSAKLSGISTSEASEKYHLVRRKAMMSVLEKRNSQLVHHVDTFLRASYEYDIDPYLLVSIAGLESSFAKRMIHGTYNAYGWGSGHITFKSWEDGIVTISKALREKYIARGATSVHAIGRIYAASPTWANRVTGFMNTFYREEAKYRSVVAVL